jgi:hypothetical protein
MRTHSEIIGAADCDRLAELRGVSVHTVRSWGQRNSIPAEHWPALVEAEVTTLPELIAGVKPRERRVAA